MSLCINTNSENYKTFKDKIDWSGFAKPEKCTSLPLDKEHLNFQEESRRCTNTLWMGQDQSQTLMRI